MGTDTRSTSALGVAIRDLARFNKVLGIVVLHGFGGIVARTPLGKRFMTETPLAEGDEELRSKPEAVRFRKLLEALGPTYIKLGQILSMRVDILPADYIRELEMLQDNAPVLPFEAIKTAVETGLGHPLSELYADFDQTPLATASIAQTHLATTYDGKRVVVKVQRPGIEDVMRSDLDLLYLGARILEAAVEEAVLYSPSDVIVQFERALVRELNFTHELSNLQTARQLLDTGRPVTVPEPSPELSCRTVLTMDFFPGKAIRTLVPDSPQAHHAVEEILEAACKQVLVDGFYHADPHPGNILINEDGGLCMIDLGMVGRLSWEQREDLITLMMAAIMSDVNTLARVLIKIGTPTQRINMAEFKAEIRRIRREQLEVSSFDSYDSGRFVQEFVNAANRFRIKLNPDYSVLTKASATLEGIIRTLHPNVDIVGIARPYLEGMVRQRYAPQKLIEEAMTGVTGVGALIRNIPDQLDQVLHDMETGNLQVHVVTPELDNTPAQLHTLGSRLGMIGFSASMSVCAAILLPNDPTTVWHVPLLSVLCILLAVVGWTILWWWHFIGHKASVSISPLVKFFKRS